MLCKEKKTHNGIACHDVNTLNFIDKVSKLFQQVKHFQQYL